LNLSSKIKILDVSFESRKFFFQLTFIFLLTAVKIFSAFQNKIVHFLQMQKEAGSENAI